MALSPTSSRGGFSGGTVPNASTFTAPLTVAPTDPNPGVGYFLDVTSPAGTQTNGPFIAQVLDENGATHFALDAYGNMNLIAPAGVGNFGKLLVSQRAAGGGYVTLFSSNSGGAGMIAARAGVAQTDNLLYLELGGNPIFVVPPGGGFASAPPASSASTLALGAAYQNALAYDVLVVVFLSVTVNTSGVLKLGVGPTNTPTQQTLVTGITSTGLWTVPIYLPSGYYALLSTTGTITVAVDGQIAMPV